MHALILGLDALDAGIFERLSGSGRLPNLTRLSESGRYSRLEVANPPQSEVSWTSIATGLNPGGHGIFDFVQRDAQTYSPYLSLLPTKKGLLGTEFVRPFSTTTIFEEAARQGYPVTVMWWPAMFPARPELPVNAIPGLGTPDILGRLGVGTLFCSDTALVNQQGKIPILPLERAGRSCYSGSIPGPIGNALRGSGNSELGIQLQIHDQQSARLRIGEHDIELVAATWSPIVELTFKLGLFKAHAVTQLLLTRVRPYVELYVLPLQLHPLRPMWRYGSPGSFVRQLWQENGPFLTLGMPQDTTALEEGCISDEQFLALCESIFETRRRMLMGQLARFREGLLAVVFDSLDRVQHMFWRDRPDVVERWYVRLDHLVGEVVQRLADLGIEKAKVIAISDHGITRFDYKVHLNRWLAERGYLVKRTDSESNDLREVDWSRSQAYAVGLNSLYLNKAGREAQGCVQADQSGGLITGLRHQLLGWRGPDGHPVVSGLWRHEEAFSGPLAAHGPDLVVGYASGYRGSAETGLGKWKVTALEPNLDRWSSDHCVDYQAVPGVLFSNCGLEGYRHPSYRDIPEITIGMTPAHCEPSPPPTSSDDEQEVLEERLRGLGYLA